MTGETFALAGSGRSAVYEWIAEGKRMHRDWLSIRMAGQTTVGIVFPSQVAAMARFAARHVSLGVGGMENKIGLFMCLAGIRCLGVGIGTGRKGQKQK